MSVNQFKINFWKLIYNSIKEIYTMTEVTRIQARTKRSNFIIKNAKKRKNKEKKI